jgi:hypothetical protein
MTPTTPVVPPGMVQPVFYNAKRLTLCDPAECGNWAWAVVAIGLGNAKTRGNTSMLAPSIVKFKRVLQPESHLSNDFAVRTANSRQATANPPSSTTADPGSTSSNRPELPVPSLGVIDRSASPDHLFQPSWVGSGPAPDQTACT